MLTRLGVRFTDQQKRCCNNLTATGRGAEAQAHDSRHPQQQIWWHSAGNGQHLRRAHGATQNTFGNIKEEIGGAFLPVLEDLAKALTETFEGQGTPSRLSLMG